MATDKPTFVLFLFIGSFKSLRVIFNLQSRSLGRFVVLFQYPFSLQRSFTDKFTYWNIWISSGNYVVNFGLHFFSVNGTKPSFSVQSEDEFAIRLLIKSRPAMFLIWAWQPRSLLNRRGMVRLLGYRQSGDGIVSNKVAIIGPNTTRIFIY